MLQAKDWLSLGGNWGEQILHMRNRQCYSEKVILGKMTSQSRVKHYLKQTLYLECQCTQLLSKYWLDAKPDPGSKSRKKKVMKKRSIKGY